MTPATKIVSNSSPLPQCKKPSFSLSKTASFFDKLVSKKGGDQVGAVELRELGILLHPGVTTKTDASFSTLGFQQPVTFAAWICSLPPEALANPDSGVAGLEFFLDGRPTGRVVLDRHTNSYHTFDLKGVREVKVVADNGNGKSMYDWLFIGLI